MIEPKLIIPSMFTMTEGGIWFSFPLHYPNLYIDINELQEINPRLPYMAVNLFSYNKTDLGPKLFHSLLFTKVTSGFNGRWDSYNGLNARWGNIDE